MSATYDLTIIIVNFNGEALLRGLLESIQRNGGDLNVQVIVFDNASSDGSAQMVAAEFGWVCLESSERNIGFSQGNNSAARLAQAPLLLLLNNDTQVRAGALQAMVQFMNHRPDVAAIGPALLESDGRLSHGGRNFPTLAALLDSIQFLRWTGLFRSAHQRYRRPNMDENATAPVAQVPAAALMVRRTAFEQCDGLDDGFQFGVEDVDFCKRLGRIGPIYYLPAAQIEHIGRVSSNANRNFVYRSYQCGWARYLRKHHGRAAACVYKTLLTLDMPVRIGLLGMQWMAQRLAHRTEKAARTRSRLQAAAAFASGGLFQFWMS